MVHIIRTDLMTSLTMIIENQNDIEFVKQILYSEDPNYEYIYRALVETLIRQEMLILPFKEELVIRFNHNSYPQKFFIRMNGKFEQAYYELTNEDFKKEFYTSLRKVIANDREYWLLKELPESRIHIIY